MPKRFFDQTGGDINICYEVYSMSTVTRKQILDPLTSLFKLGLLTFYPNGTKIIIHGNIINLQEPGYGQAFVRYFYSYNKDDISILYGTLKKAMEWYLLEEDEDDSPTQDNPGLTKRIYRSIFATQPNKEEPSLTPNIYYSYQTIIEFAIQGLKKLQRTYGEGNVIYTIQYFIVMLQRSLDGSIEWDDFCEELEQPEPAINHQIIRDAWDEETIEQLAGMMTSCQKLAPELRGNYVQSIEALLNSADERFQTLVQNMNANL